MIVDEARQRAAAFLAATDFFAALGLGELSTDARMIARLALELADAYEDELRGRRVVQANYERAMGVITSRAYRAGRIPATNGAAKADTGPF